MKSDTATIQSRRNRLLELLADGKNQTEAAEILKAEGFPAFRNTISRDMSAMKTDFNNENMTELDKLREKQLQRLADMRDEIDVEVALKPDRKYDLLLGIIDREIALLGTKAPSRSFSVSANVDVDPQTLVGYRRFVAETRRLSPEEVERVYQLARALTAEQARKPLEAYFPTEEEPCD